MGNCKQTKSIPSLLVFLTFCIDIRLVTFQKLIKGLLISVLDI